MRKSLVVLFLISLGSCGENEETAPDKEIISESCLDGQCRYTFKNNSQISLSEQSAFGTIIDGNNLVFIRRFIKNDEPDIADDELVTVLIFEVPSDVQQFEITSSDLVHSKALYRQGCFCAKINFEYVDSGKITGTRLSDGSWSVSADLIIDYFKEFENFESIRIQFEQTFIID